MTDHFGWANLKHCMTRCTDGHVTKFVATQSGFQRPAPENARPHTDTRANRSPSRNNSCSKRANRFPPLPSTGCSCSARSVGTRLCTCTLGCPARKSDSSKLELCSKCTKNKLLQSTQAAKPRVASPTIKRRLIHIYRAVTLRTLQMPYDKVFLFRGPQSTESMAFFACVACRSSTVLATEQQKSEPSASSRSASVWVFSVLRSSVKRPQS